MRLLKTGLGRILSNAGTTVVLLGAIGIGAAIGLTSRSTGAALAAGVDPAVLVLVFLLFFEVRFERLGLLRSSWSFIALAWTVNFLVIPTIGFGVASLFLTGQPLFLTGLMIYFTAPCTDWFLGFTRLARGNTALGAALLPVNMVSQLLLYPVFLRLFADTETPIDPAGSARTIATWFLLPLALAVGAHLLVKATTTAPAFDRILDGAGRLVPWVIAFLVLEIFAANVTAIVEHGMGFARILPAVVLFFVVTFLVGELAGKVFGLAYPEHALLSMTTAARNAPLMLGLTTVALPGQPIVYAAIVIGMLIEFPHLTAIKHILLSRRRAAGEAVTPTELGATSPPSPR